MGVANIKLSSIYPDIKNNMRILIHKLNYKQLGKTVRLIKKEFPRVHSITLIYIPMIGNVNKGLFLGLKGLRKPLNDFLMLYQNKINISLSNIPYCVLDKEFWHMRSKGLFPGKQIKFSKECLKCRMYEECCGFYKSKFNKSLFEDVAPIKDLPEEVVIEVTSRCNLNCSFCFNKNSFAKNRRGEIDLPEKKTKKIIDDAAKNNIEYIRFTGGEPLLRKDIFELLKYAKSKGFKEVRLNTNGTLVNSNNIKRLEKYVDNVLVPLNSWCTEEDAKCTGMKDVFKKRVNAVKTLKKSKISVVRSGTIALPANIKHLEEIFELIKRLKLDSWEVYRPVPTPKNRKPISGKDIKILVDKLLGFKKQGCFVPIANALPFCSYDQAKINQVSLGAKYDDGHCRIVVDVRGYAKPSYFIDVDIGEPTNITKCWNSKFMKDLRGLKLINKGCKSCYYLGKCKGGSRFAANLINGGYNEIDPLSYEPFVSIIISTYNRKNTLKLVLSSLFKQNYPKNKYELIIIDDGSNDGTKEFIEKLKKKSYVKLNYFRQERKGFRPARTHNLAAKKAKRELLLFINDDIIPIKDFILRHVNAQKRADVVLGYRAGYKSDRPYTLKEIKGTSPQIIKEFREEIFNDTNLSSSVTNPWLWKFFVGGNFSIKKDIFDKNKFDESFVGYGEEDIELGYRLQKKNYKIILDKGCLGFHYHRETGANKNYTKKKLSEATENLRRFYKKHKNKEIANYISEKYVHLPFDSLNVDKKDFEGFIKSIRK